MVGRVHGSKNCPEFRDEFPVSATGKQYLLDFIRIHVLGVDDGPEHFEIQFSSKLVYHNADFIFRVL